MTDHFPICLGKQAGQEQVGQLLEEALWKEQDLSSLQLQHDKLKARLELADAALPCTPPPTACTNALESVAELPAEPNGLDLAQPQQEEVHDLQQQLAKASSEIAQLKQVFVSCRADHPMPAP